ncbi:hypothetical protein SDC9_211015 [bioreactor metagenome]|uniref:HTH-type transcriptional repressor PurR n=1 Tax=bioreactor metagenome TaxID=1076179 RepID=A0A645JHS9_9ZZZZ
MVQPDPMDGMRKALAHLWLNGHTKIAFVGDMTTPVLSFKVNAFLAGWKFYRKIFDNDLLENTHSHHGSLADMGLSATKHLMERRPDCTAIIYDSDCMAIGGLGAFLQSEKTHPRRFEYNLL